MTTHHQHVNPGPDATWDPVFVPDIYREKPGKKEEPMYLISESELDQIKNDCLYPERPNCDGCECVDGIDDTRASGLGCNFKGANVLMDEVIARGPVVQQEPIITLPQDTTNLECIKEGLSALSDYFNAAIRGDENKKALERMWNLQMDILSVLLKNECPKDCIYKRFAASMANAEAHDATIRNQTLEEVIQHLESKRIGIMRIAMDGSSMGVLDGTISYLESLRSEVSKE